MTARMPTTPRLERRALFGLAGASLLSGQGPQPRLAPAVATDEPTAVMALATPIHDAGPALNVAGPRDGDLAAWARRLAPSLAAGLMERGGLDLRYGGGIDGVTGANQFDARAVPDGREALLFPGSVALDWLAGLRPVRLDPARVLPLLAVLGSGVLMVRGALPAPGAGTPLRLAGEAARDGMLVALLGLDLLGVPAIRVRQESQANAIFLFGPQAASRVPSLMASGYSAALSTGGTARFGQAPFFLASLPDARLRRDPLVAAWRALAGAADLCAALVLPRLCPAAAIGRWRRAALAGLADDGLIEQARRQGLHLLGGAGAIEALAPMRLAAGPHIALRRWLSDRA